MQLTDRIKKSYILSFHHYTALNTGRRGLSHFRSLMLSTRNCLCKISPTSPATHSAALPTLFRISLPREFVDFVVTLSSWWQRDDHHLFRYMLLDFEYVGVWQSLWHMKVTVFCFQLQTALLQWWQWRKFLSYSGSAKTIGWLFIKCLFVCFHFTWNCIKLELLVDKNG